MEIKLGGKLAAGRTTIIDPEDIDRVVGFSWSIDTDGYAIAAKTRVKLHRLIMDAKLGQTVDHINRNRLDNRKVNLRLCTNRENSWNHSFKPGASGYFGVSRAHNASKPGWCANISVNNKTVYIGTFDTPEAAALAYDQYAIKVRGVYARTNFSQSEAQHAA